LWSPFGAMNQGVLDFVSAQLFKRAPEIPGNSRGMDVVLPGFSIGGERESRSSPSNESGAPSSPPGMAPESPVPRVCTCYVTLGDGEGAGPPAVGPSFYRPMSRLP